MPKWKKCVWGGGWDGGWTLLPTPLRRYCNPVICCQSFCLSINLSFFCQTFCRPVCLTICLFVYPHVRLSVSLSVCPSVSQSSCLSLNLSVSLCFGNSDSLSPKPTRIYGIYIDYISFCLYSYEQKQKWQNTWGVLLTRKRDFWSATTHTRKGDFFLRIHALTCQVEWRARDYKKKYT